MGRLGLLLLVIILLPFFLALTGCGGSSTPPATPVPAIISVTPSSASMDIGTTLSFTASALDSGKHAVNASVTFQSSNPAVLTMLTSASSGGTAAGLACGGTWDTGGQVCTPGGSGVTQVTATSGGVTSAPVTVYVHQHIDKISVIPQTNTNPCVSAAPALAQSAVFTAVASSGNIDISSSVGPFNWTATNPAVAQLFPQSVNGVRNGLVSARPKTPGVTQIFASIANTTSVPFNFTTCPVQSISLSVRGTGGTTITAAKGASSTVAASVFDTTGNAVVAPLTFASSNPTVASVSASGGVTSSTPGGTTITASCTPPTCNIGFVPAQPVYALQPITATYTGTNTTANSIYATSTGCGTTPKCEAILLPVTGNPAALGNGVALPSIPNSFVFNAAGTKAYLGSQTGLMQFDPAAATNSVSVSPATTGKVLAISPKGDRVIVSDTQSSSNKLFILDPSSNTSVLSLITGTNVATPAGTITGQTAAAFSPDGLKAYIFATNPKNFVTNPNVPPPAPCSVTGGCTLYVYSAQAPLQTIDLTDPTLGPATDIAFLGNGSYGYMARVSGLSFLATCDDPGDPTNPLPTQVGSVATPASLIRPLPDGKSLLTLDPPNVSSVTSNLTALPGTPTPITANPPQVIGCPAPYTLSFPPPPSPSLPAQGFLTNTTATNFTADSGLGTFTPTAFLLSSDGQKAYILAANVLDVNVFDVASHTTTPLALTGNAAPIAGSLSSDGQTLYVTTSDNVLHIVNLVSGGDTAQLALPSANLCALTTGGSVSSCKPDLLAVRP
jgi:hypothetical protein